MTEILFPQNKTKQTAKAKVKPNTNKIRAESTNLCRLNQLALVQQAAGLHR
jgi:hypothetical protein